MLVPMIAHLRGRLIAKHPNQAIVETGGVGYDVVISVPTFSELPLLLRDSGSKIEFLDTTVIHVEAIVDELLR